VRDIGTLVWVVLVFIGVIGSMVSSVRKQVQAQQGPRAVRRPPSPQLAPPPPLPPVSAAPVPQASARPHTAGSRARVASTLAAELVHPAPHAARRRLFAHKGDLVRGIIAAEVLGKPRALRDEDFPY